MGKNAAALAMIAKGKAHSEKAHALARTIAGNLRIYKSHPSAGLKRIIEQTGPWPGYAPTTDECPALEQYELALRSG